MVLQPTAQSLSVATLQDRVRQSGWSGCISRNVTYLSRVMSRDLVG